MDGDLELPRESESKRVLLASGASDSWEQERTILDTRVTQATTTRPNKTKTDVRSVPNQILTSSREKKTKERMEYLARNLRLSLGIPLPRLFVRIPLGPRTRFERNGESGPLPAAKRFVLLLGVVNPTASFRGGVEEEPGATRRPELYLGRWNKCRAIAPDRPGFSVALRISLEYF